MQAVTDRLFLVRHAKAGSRSDWSGDDHLRPLSKAGWKQAEALAERLADPTRGGQLYSSTYLRCIQTIEPLANRLKVRIVADARLSEEAGFEGALELLAELAAGSVLCSHGDVIPETIAALGRRGCSFLSPPEWRKASVWLLDRNRLGQVITAKAWPPPNAD